VLPSEQHKRKIQIEQVTAWRQKMHDELLGCTLQHGGPDGLLDSLEGCTIGRYLLDYEKAVLALGELWPASEWGQEHRKPPSGFTVCQQEDEDGKPEGWWFAACSWCEHVSGDFSHPADARHAGRVHMEECPAFPKGETNG
jgi:hypothetical protein